jgi:hypothetical protein
LRSSANSRTLNKPAKPRGFDASKLSDAERQKLELRTETFVVAWSVLLLALLTLSYSYSHGLMLLYGDAVAHLAIARRIIDSIEPGFRQMGSVWLPLPHLLLLPFVWRMEWWQTGLAGAFPSMGAYVFGAAGIYRLARNWLSPQVALIGLLFYALNPGLLYMQTTAMNEPLFLAEMIWTALLLVEYRRALDANEDRQAAKVLIATGVVLVGAVFTRMACRAAANAQQAALADAGRRRVRAIHGDGGSCAPGMDGLLRAPVRRSAGLHARPVLRQSD